MAFLKIVASLVVGGGIGYATLQLIVPKESDIIKHLPPNSSEPRPFFKSYKSLPEIFMSEQKKLNSLETRDDANTGK